MDIIQRPKGTRDILPDTLYKWQYVEKKLTELLDKYNFKEIRLPVFEYTELFQRGVGETTDVVQKEMYTFDDKGGRSITLRPEGTAGTVRAYLENGMASSPSPLKLWYNMSMYRYENVQKGRLREFHQIGAEIIGTGSPLADVEVILLGNDIFKILGISDIKLNINNIGCPTCRKEYQKAFKEFVGDRFNEYCDTCKTRFDKNPMRILDCKEEKCKKLNVGAPVILDYLCEECKTHFETVKEMLKEAGINYSIDSGIVRGLDYYTKTVFEFIDEKTGLTALGGGRYDGLVKEFGGQHTPAVGWALGLERLIEMFEENQNTDLKKQVPDIYILSCGKKENVKAIVLAKELRLKNISVEKDILDRSFNSQLKYADKTGAKNLLIIGENELNTGKAKLKNMKTGEQKEIELDVKNILEELREIKG